MVFRVILVLAATNRPDILDLALLRQGRFERQVTVDRPDVASRVKILQISGTSMHNNKAVQVDAVATSLNSYDYFLLQTGKQGYTSKKVALDTAREFSLHGNMSNWLNRYGILDNGPAAICFKFMRSSNQSEFSEDEPLSIVIMKVRDPRLFSYSFNKEDILILDTHLEVFIWVGQSVDSKEKQTAFDIGQSWLQIWTGYPQACLYTEFQKETNIFTTFFSWDSAKANVHGNSFQKKILLMFEFGGRHAAENIVGARLSFFNESLLDTVRVLKLKYAKILSFKDLEKALCRALQEQPNLRGVIYSSLQILIRQNKEVIEGENETSGKELSICEQRAVSRYTSEVAARNLDVLRSSAREILPTLSGIFIKSSKDDGGSLQFGGVEKHSLHNLSVFPGGTGNE
ncbi:villin headpiece, Villin/Gelsolin, ADF-H/Gelsolin-like domain protein [Artemisia annua]|uniref:Villin headpiece, Villin/Gelsolin, ADF-H/Gelsolin-like domain protein n=1 Tax=Artemisia annua TaxID=35608 RepID=A0A2U1PH68_ARTAN|nr:villin headpiece, Villin/Gelsolin, ADF-H/Gelsolin-like domain protein [Artemisia annua]